MVESASKQLEPLNIAFAVVDEESCDVRAWLNEVAPETLRGDCPRGGGSLFWLEGGSVVDHEVAGGKLKVVEFLARTRDRWS
jgi:hypothetical protein